MIYEPALCGVVPRLEKPADQNLREISQKKKKKKEIWAALKPISEREEEEEEERKLAARPKPESEGRRRKQRRKSARGTEGEFSRSASNICFPSELFSLHVKGRKKKKRRLLRLPKETSRTFKLSDIFIHAHTSHQVEGEEGRRERG